MQVEKVKEFGKRMVLLWCKNLLHAAGKGKPYHKLSPVIVVAIIDFTMFPDKREYKSIHHIADAKNR
jgi:predicted transposase/invertase (TIGR01784 family)